MLSDVAELSGVVAPGVAGDPCVVPAAPNTPKTESEVSRGWCSRREFGASGAVPKKRGPARAPRTPWRRPSSQGARTYSHTPLSRAREPLTRAAERARERDKNNALHPFRSSFFSLHDAAGRRRPRPGPGPVRRREGACALVAEGVSPRGAALSLSLLTHSSLFLSLQTQRQAPARQRPRQPAQPVLPGRGGGEAVSGG